LFSFVLWLCGMPWRREQQTYLLMCGNHSYIILTFMSSNS